MRDQEPIRLLRDQKELAARFGKDEVALATKYLFLRDSEADKLAQYIREDTSGKAKKLFDQAVENGIQSIEKPPKVFKEYFKCTEHVPEWVDWDQLDRGAIAITKTLLLGPLAFQVGLGSTYVSNQATLLAMTGHLEKRAERRMVESTIYFSKVFKPGNMKPGNAGFKEAIRIRLIHAFARTHIEKSPDFSVQNMGEPINQYDTAGGQFYQFSELLMNLGEKFGITYSYQEKNDVYALWRYICHLQGVPDEILAKNVEEANRRSALLKATFEPNDDSRSLLKALFENTKNVDTMFMNKIFPEKLSVKLVEKGYYERLKYSALRHVLGDELADKMAVPKSSRQSRLGIKLLAWSIGGSYRSILKRPMGELNTVIKIAEIGEGLIEEYYRAVKTTPGVIDNSAA